jgi:hypothetical protein
MKKKIKADKFNKVILQEIDPKAKYIVLLKNKTFPPHLLEGAPLPKDINPANFVFWFVDDVKKAVRFVKIPENDKEKETS